MHHYIYHPRKKWLRIPDGEPGFSWVKELWRATNFSEDHMPLALMAIGPDRDAVAILPDSGYTADWYSQPQLISFRLSQTRYEWIQERIRPHWDRVGNCSWFIDHENRSYGPISAHSMGGYTLPFATDGKRYESVFIAAARMMQGIVEQFPLKTPLDS